MDIALSFKYQYYMKTSLRTFIKHTAKDFHNKSVNPPVVRASTIIFKNLQEIEKAEKNFNKSIEINSKHVQAFVNLGNLFKNSGDIEKAEIYYEDAIGINPKYFEAYNNLMDLLERTNQNEKFICSNL